MRGICMRGAMVGLLLTACGFESVQLEEIAGDSARLGDPGAVGADQDFPPGSDDDRTADAMLGDSATGTGDDSTPGDASSSGDSQPAPSCDMLGGGTNHGTSVVQGAVTAVGTSPPIDSERVDMQGLVALFNFDGSASLTQGAALTGNGPANFAASAIAPDNALLFADGHVGRALALDGEGDGLTLLDPIDATGPLTVAVWFRADDNRDAPILSLVPENGNYPLWELSLSQGISKPSLRAGWSGNCSGFSAMGGFGGIELGHWYHLVLVYEAGLMMTAYINGAYADAAGAVTQPCETPATWQIGTTRWASFRGRLDELAIWSRSLTQQEVEQLYRMQAPVRWGRFVSGVCDATEAVTWRSLAPVPSQPAGKPLPITSESAYPGGNLSTEGLAAYWPFDGDGQPSVGTSIGDQRGEQAATLRSTLSGKTPSYAEGRVGNSITLWQPGSSRTWLELDAETDLMRNVSGMSFSVWVRPWQVDEEVTLVAVAQSAGNTNPRLALGLDQTSRFWGFVAPVDASNAFVHTGIGTAPISEWTHVVLSMNLQTHTMEVFLNGRLTTSTPGILEQFSATSDTASAGGTIGANLTQDAEYFSGWLDELSIWHRPLSASDALALYQRGARHLNYRVRVCLSADCGGVLFRGPTGAAAPATYSETLHFEPQLPVFPLGYNTGRYFQFEAVFSAYDPASVRLVDVTVAPAP